MPSNSTDSKESAPGPELCIVGTPIGNLEDITLRALRTLREVDLILSEDTRKTGILLKRHEIKTPQKSYRIHQLEADTEHALDQLRQGRRLALCTDAGTPAVSDPGVHLIRRVRQAMPEVPITPIPGPSALTAALSVCGWQTNPALYLGFLSPKPGRRRGQLERHAAFEGPIVIFESPHRLRKLIPDIRAIFSGRDIFIAREMSKIYEEFTILPGSAADTPELPPPKGEFTVIIGPPDGQFS